MSTQGKVFMILVFCFLSGFPQSEAKIKLIVPKYLRTTTEAPTERPKSQCNCGSVPLDILICANNGLTYTSTCQFQCVQKQIPDLRITKKGTCAGVTLGMHHAASKKRP